LVAALVDTQDPQPGAVVDGSELVIALARAFERLDELHVNLDLVARQRLLVALPTLFVAFVAL
jgi:hypothetical protein